MTWNDKSELRRSVGNLKKLDNLDLKKKKKNIGNQNIEIFLQMVDTKEATLAASR